MAFQSVPDTVEVVLDFLMSGTPTANVLHFIKPGGYNQSALDNLAGRVQTQLVDHYLPMLTLTQALNGVRVKGLSTENDLQASNSDDSATGTVVQTALPNNVSLCLTLRTGVTGRSARGRFYCQPPNDGDLATPNTVTTTYKNAMIALLGDIVTAANGAGFSLVVVSRFTNKTKRAVGVTFSVTDIIARNTRLDSQRGRMPLPT